jgi:hypothetical protein
MPNYPLAQTLAPLSRLGVETHLGVSEDDGWVPASRLAEDDDELRAALRRISSTLAIDRDDVSAAQLIELWTWLVAAPAAAALVGSGRLPDVSSENVVLRAEGGLADWRAGLRSARFHALPDDPAAAHVDALPAADEEELVGRLGSTLHAHLVPLVERLNRLARRPERALWRSAADRVAGAFLWIGDQLGEHERSHALARGVVAAAPVLEATVRVQCVDGTRVHLRQGCCLYYRVPGAPKCIGCPLVTDAERARRVADGRRGYGASMAKKILALVSEPVSGEALKSAVGRERAEAAEVLVVAPALGTRRHFLLSDVDGAIERADQVQEETVERMEEEGVDAAGDTGESDPLLAIQDALQTFPADEIVLFTHPGGAQNWAEEGLAEEARSRFGKPVEQLVVESG